MIVFLTLAQVIKAHDNFIEKFGGLRGIRDINLLISAIESPKSTFSGKDLYPSIYDKAAVYLFQIVRNHPFNDGNKRTGFAAVYIFLKSNKIPICFEEKKLEKLVVELAKGKTTKEEIAFFLEYGIDPFK